MNTIRLIQQWCEAAGHTFIYGSTSQINERLTYADYSASAGGVVVFATLLTAGTYDNGKDHDNVAVYFSALCDFDFDPLQVADLQNTLKEASKGLLQWLQAGNAAVWSGARYSYGYDDYAENVCWCCLRVTVDSITADCVPAPIPEPAALQVRMLPAFGRAMLEALGYYGTLCELCSGMWYVGDGTSGTIVAIAAASEPAAAWLVDFDGNILEETAAGMEITREAIDDMRDDIPEEWRVAAVEELESVMGWYICSIFTADGDYAGRDVRLIAGGTPEEPEWSGEWCTVEGE